MRRVRKLQPKLTSLSTKNIRTNILQTSELQRETISENNLIYNLMIWEKKQKTFKVIRTLLDKDAGINLCKTVDFIIDNRLVCDYNVISNMFNDYFISIGSILANSIHCNVNPLLYVDNIHQYGFRKCHSTNHAIITLVEKVARALDSRVGVKPL